MTVACQTPLSMEFSKQALFCIFPTPARSSKTPPLLPIPCHHILFGNKLVQRERKLCFVKNKKWGAEIIKQ